MPLIFEEITPIFRCFVLSSLCHSYYEILEIIQDATHA